MELLIAYMCPCGLEIDISSYLFPHFWKGNSRKSQVLSWAACSVPRKADQAVTNSEICGMQGPGTECGLSIGFDALLLSFQTNRMLLFSVSLCLCPPGQNSGICNIWKGRGYRTDTFRRGLKCVLANKFPVVWRSCTVFLHSCPPLSSIVLGEPGRGTQPNRVAFDARSQFDRAESNGRFMSLVLRCNDRKSFSVVTSMPAQNSLIAPFQLSIRRRRMALDLPCSSSWPTQPEQWHDVAAHRLHFGSAHRAHEREVSMPPLPTAGAFYIGWHSSPRPGKCSTRLPSAPRTPVYERRHPVPALQVFDHLHVMDLWLCGES